MHQYQAMSSRQCLETLMHALDNKSVCHKFSSAHRTCPSTHNMVTTVHLSCKGKKIDLQTIYDCTINSTYDRKKFAAITIRIDSPKTTALLFSSGKLVITGAVCRQMSICAVRSIVCMLNRIFPYEGFRANSFAIQNIVSNVVIKDLKNIDLTKMYAELSSQCTFQPSIFPGLVLRPDNSPIVLLIFNSSRIVVTGARTYEDICHGFDSILPVLSKYFLY